MKRSEIFKLAKDIHDEFSDSMRFYDCEFDANLIKHLILCRTKGNINIAKGVVLGLVREFFYQNDIDSFIREDIREYERLKEEDPDSLKDAFAPEKLSELEKYAGLGFNNKDISGRMRNFDAKVDLLYNLHLRLTDVSDEAFAELCRTYMQEQSSEYPTGIPEIDQKRQKGGKFDKLLPDRLINNYLGVPEEDTRTDFDITEKISFMRSFNETEKRLLYPWVLYEKNVSEKFFQELIWRRHDLDNVEWLLKDDGEQKDGGDKADQSPRIGDPERIDEIVLMSLWLSSVFHGDFHALTRIVKVKDVAGKIVSARYKDAFEDFFEAVTRNKSDAEVEKTGHLLKEISKAFRSLKEKSMEACSGELEGVPCVIYSVDGQTEYKIASEVSELRDLAVKLRIMDKKESQEFTRNELVGIFERYEPERNEDVVVSGGEPFHTGERTPTGRPVTHEKWADLNYRCSNACLMAMEGGFIDLVSRKEYRDKIAGIIEKVNTQGKKIVEGANEAVWAYNYLLSFEYSDKINAIENQWVDASGFVNVEA